MCEWVWFTYYLSLTQEGCGFHPRGEATQVYSLDRHHGDLSLSGTAEVPLAGT